MAVAYKSPSVFNALAVALPLHYQRMLFLHFRTKPNQAHEEKQMSNDVNMARQAVHDKLEAQIKTAEAKLDTLKARASNTRANVELKGIAELLAKRQVIRQKLQELKGSGGDRWQQTKADLDSQISELQKSVKAIESKVHSH